MMKKTALHIFSILLALVMILSGFSGCTTFEYDETGEIEETPADRTETCETGEAETDATEETTGNETYEGEEGGSDYSDYLTVVSYNIKCAYYGKSWAGVIENIQSVDADIIGLQECDDGTTRSSSTPGEYSNQVQQLAHDMGYAYWYFSKTIDHKGGSYGHGVLSRFPIIESQVIFFKSQKDEIRNMERHVLDVNGTELVFYNTHLNGSFYDQFYEVMNAIERDYAAGKYILLTGDFNIAYKKLAGRMNVDHFLPLNGNDTFCYGLEGITRIDNIIISRNIEDYYMDESTQIGVLYLDAEEEDSDHPMIYSYIKLPT